MFRILISLTFAIHAERYSHSIVAGGLLLMS